MRKKIILTLLSLGVVVLIGMGIRYLFTLDIPVLQPKGIIGLQQKDLLVLSTWLMLIVVIPVFIMVGLFAWKYRATNKKASYKPDWDHSHIAEAIWWGIPCLIIIALSVITWKSTHDLDPYKPLVSNKKPLKIQVVALQWKWLFIYPEQKIATINFIQFPENTPIHFEITGQSPMNSFWIPQLGGQIFAMPGMNTELHLMADKEGEFRGCSANISGNGFAGMVFTAKASTDAEFEAWVGGVKKSSKGLTQQEYEKIAEPSEYDPVSLYVLKQDKLYDSILMKYMEPVKEK